MAREKYNPPKRVEIPYPWAETLEKFKRKHRDATMKKFCCKCIEHLLRDNGSWSNNAFEELKKEFGEEIAL